MDEESLDYEGYYSSADCDTRLHHYPLNLQYADVANSNNMTSIHRWSQIPPQDMGMFSSPDQEPSVYQLLPQHQNHQLQPDTPVDNSVQRRSLDALCNPSQNQQLQHSSHHHQSCTSSPQDRCFAGRNQLDGQLRVSGSSGSPQCSLALASPPPLPPPSRPPLPSDTQSVPQKDSIPRVSRKSPSSGINESATDCVFSYLSEVQSRQPESGHVHGYFPSRAVFPGNYGFGVSFNSTSAAYSYCEQSKVLYVNKGVDFAAIFSFTTPPSPGFSVRTLVCTKNAEDFQKVGVVKTCAQHLHQDKGSNHFLTCRNNNAHYREHHGHSIITVPVDSLPECDLGPMCVYSCSCYSTCIVGKSVNKPTLVIIFSLIDNTKVDVVGQEVVTLKCCACPNRDASKLKLVTKRNGGGIAKKKKKKNRTSSLHSSPSPQLNVAASLFPLVRSLPPQMNLVGDVEPDEEGCFTFTWRLRDRSIFNFLSILKEGYRRMENLS